MLWFSCLPHLTGHKMSGNYIRVIPSVSTIVGKISGWIGKAVVRGLPTTGNHSIGRVEQTDGSVSMVGELQRGRQVREPEGRSQGGVLSAESPERRTTVRRPRCSAVPDPHPRERDLWTDRGTTL